MTTSQPHSLQFADRDAQTDALEARTLAALREGLAARGRAVLAVSGGSTPKPLYERLAQADLDWPNIDIVLIDERWVAPGEPGSNETMIRQALLTGPAEAARFFGLYRPLPDPQAAVEPVSEALAPALADGVDVAILGLGVDGHTASWFPDAEGLETALDPHAGPVAAIRAIQSPVTGPHVLRLTLTFEPLAGARHLFLMITGADKAEALERAACAAETRRAPIHALLAFERSPPLTVFWAP